MARRAELIRDGAARAAQKRAMEKSLRAFVESDRAAKRSAEAVEAFQRALQESEQATCASMVAEKRSKAAMIQSEKALADSRRAVQSGKLPKVGVVEALRNSVKAIRFSQMILEDLEQVLERDMAALERLRQAAGEQEEARRIVKEAEFSLDEAHEAVEEVLNGSETIVEDVEEAPQESEEEAGSTEARFEEPLTVIESRIPCAGLCRKPRVQGELRALPKESDDEQGTFMVKLQEAQKAAQKVYVAQKMRQERLSMISSSTPVELAYLRRTAKSNKVLLDMMEKLRQLRLRQLMEKTSAFRVPAKL